MKKAIKVGTLFSVLALMVPGLALAANNAIVTSVAADVLEGTYSYQLQLDGSTNKAYVQDNTPDFETVYRAKFLFKINGIAASDTQKRMTILLGRQDLGATKYTVMRTMVINTVNFGMVGRTAVRKDNGNWAHCADWTWPTATGPASVRDIEINWSASTAPGADDGYCSVTVNGDLKGEGLNIDNDSIDIDQVWMGATEGNIVAFTGYPVFDSFESYRTLAP